MAGRPTKYKEEYCQMLIDHMEKGFSFNSFAGIIRVNTDTLAEWRNKHKSFSDAQKLGRALSSLFWEKMGMAGAAGRVPGFNAATWIFNMKNRFGWKDKQELDLSSKDGSMTPKYEIVIVNADQGN